MTKRLLHRRAALAALVVLSPMSAWAGAYEEFFQAIELDNGNALLALLQRGMDPNTRDPRGQHGLYLALRGGAAKAFDALLKHPQLDVNAVNAAGETPLMMAALRGNLDAMKALIGRGARVQQEGWTPLHYAASSPSAEAVRLLLEHGAEVDARAPNGNTPLMLAARWGTEAGVELLVRRGADRTLRNARGQDAADYALLDGRDAMVRFLEQVGR